MLIRYLLLALSVTMAYGCTAVTGEVKETFEYAFAEKQDAKLSSEEIKSFPYTSLYAEWQNQPRALIVLGFVDKPNDWHFITAQKETLVVRHGRVIRTQGLNHDLLAISSLKNDPLTCLVTRPGNCPTTWQREYDYQINDQTLSRDVRSNFYVREEQTLELPFGKVVTTLIEEQGRFELTGKTFTNRFWVEQDGHVVKSEQQLFPGQEFDGSPLTLTQVTWIGRDYSNKEAE